MNNGLVNNIIVNGNIVGNELENYIITELGKIRNNILGNNGIDQNMLIFVNMIRTIRDRDANFRVNYPVLSVIIKQQMEIYIHQYNLGNQLNNYLQYF